MGHLASCPQRYALVAATERRCHHAVLCLRAQVVVVVVVVVVMVVCYHHQTFVITIKPLLSPSDLCYHHQTFVIIIKTSFLVIKLTQGATKPLAGIQQGMPMWSWVSLIGISIKVCGGFKVFMVVCGGFVVFMVVCGGLWSL